LERKNGIVFRYHGQKCAEYYRRAKPDPDPRPVTGFQFKTLKTGTHNTGSVLLMSP